MYSPEQPFSSSKRNSKSIIHYSEDEDYSTSLNAIISRKASIKKKRGSKRHRQHSNPASQIMGLSGGGGGDDRRRSSVFTTSSGETAITFEDTKDESTQGKILENIRLHKEVLQSIKQEAWSMKRKLKLVKQAKSYISQHEGALQEHFTSRSAKSLVAQFNIFLITKWRQLIRELTNLSTYLIPWESRIKEIESHFGSVVASYFTFLRWLFWVNMVISLLLVVFVMMPEEVYVDSRKSSCDRKQMSRQESAISSNFSTIWEFEGRLKYSALFYGYYSPFPKDIAWGYNLPLAYFLTGLVVYIYSFVATLKKMAKNSRMSKLLSKDDEYVFSWKLFTGWDYMIGHTETSQNRTASVILGFKEALLEEAEKNKDTRNWRVILLRITVNFIILGMLVASAFAVIDVVKRSMDIADTASWWARNEITVVMSLITFFFPMVFEALGLLEYYHPRKQLRIQLARIMVLNLLNLYSLIFALFDKINHMTEELKDRKPANLTDYNLCNLSNRSDVSANFSKVALNNTFELEPLTLRLFQPNVLNFTNNCYKIIINCTTAVTMNSAMLTTLFLSNFSTIHSNITTESLAAYNKTDPTTTLETTSLLPTAVKRFDDEYNFDYDEESAAYYLEQRMRKLPNDQFEDIPINKREIDANDTLEFNTTTVNPTEETTFLDLVTQALQSTVHEAENEELRTMTYTELYTYVTGKYDDFLESYYYTEEDEEIENSEASDRKCFRWICTNQTDSSTPPISPDNEATTVSDRNTIENTTQFVPTGKDDQLIQAASKQNKFKNAGIRTLCWETMFGQELAKLTVMDLLMTILSTMILDFFRALFVRYMNNCWCWDMEKTYPKYGDFKIAENILHLVNNQGMVWMGMFFSPGLAVLNIIKLVIIMYLRSWTVLTCNVPHEVVFRASRSNNFYFALLLTMLFLCVLPVSYAIVFLEPSWHCGPFSKSERIYHLLTNATDKIVPEVITKYIVSPAAVIPLLVLLILIIYYLISLTGSLREANQDLKTQLLKERTEERRKVFKIATNMQRQQDEGANGLSNSWHKVLDSTKFRINSTTTENSESENTAGYKHRELMQRMMKKALLKEQSEEKGKVNDRPSGDAPPTECPETNHTSLSSTGTNHNYDTLNKKSKVESYSQKASAWIEKNPVITISKTSSEECVIDSDIEDPVDGL